MVSVRDFAASNTILAVDLFCGLGGATSGMRLAFECAGNRMKTIAVNHWEVARDTHEANHPEDVHLCTGVDDVDIKQLIRKHGKPKVLWLSPKCQFHSTARGGKPVRAQPRSLAECAVDWGNAADPEVILVENVPEFQFWGPLIPKKTPAGIQLWSRATRPVVDLTPKAAGWLKAQKSGLTFAQWRAGRLSWVEEATRYTETEEQPPLAQGSMRRKTWLRKLEKLGWYLAEIPDPSRRSEDFNAWKARLEVAGRGYVVDWRVLHCADYGDATRRRRFFLQAHRKDTGRVPCWPTAVRDRSTWVGAHRRVVDFSDLGKSIHNRPRPLRPKTLKRVADGVQASVQKVIEHLPELTPERVDAFLLLSKIPGAEPVDAKLAADYAAWRRACAAGFFMLAMEHGGRLLDPTLPTPTISTARGGGFAMAVPLILPQQSAGKCVGVSATLPTVATAGAIQLVTPLLVNTAHAGVRRHGDVRQPIPSVCGNRGDAALVMPLIMPKHSNQPPYSSDKLMPTLTSEGSVNLVTACLVQYYGTGHADDIREPIATVTTKQRHGLVGVVINSPDGRSWEVVDVLFRMLRPRELLRAHSFHPDSILPDKIGDSTRLIGNSNPVGTTAALTHAAWFQDPDVRHIDAALCEVYAAHEARNSQSGCVISN